MRIPPRATVSAISRWVELIPYYGVEGARVRLGSMNRYQDLSLTQYGAALEYMYQVGILGEGFVLRDPAQLFEQILVESNCVWVQDADVLVRSEAEIPEEGLAVGEALGLAPRQCYLGVKRAYSRVDSQRLKEIGDLGELAVLSLLELRDNFVVDRVASWSDSHGYDIEIQGGTTPIALEIKTTFRSNRKQFYLSRNEYEVMDVHPSWHLVYVVLDRGSAPVFLGCVDNQWIQSVSPRDCGGARGSRWATARYEVPDEFVTPGIPVVGPFVKGNGSKLLSEGYL